ncbi:MAG: FkbM family methyltransferase [Eubacteriales bacterium]
MSILEKESGEFFCALREVYSWLEDDLSREIYEVQMQYILTDDQSKFGELSKKSGVFIPVLAELEGGEYLIIYGMGRRGGLLVPVLKQLMENPLFVFCDGNYEKSGIQFGQQVLSPQRVLENYQNSKVIITPKDGQEEIEYTLSQFGVSESNIYKWDDIVSNLVVGVYRTQYFDPVINFHEKEIFVDVGALDGMTSVHFAQKCNGQYEKIYLFEAESNKRKEIETTIKTYELHNTELHMKGLWNCQDTLSFEGDLGGGSTISEGGQMTIEVDTLDNLLEGRAITFLKMDIEGAEIGALEGAKDTIQNYKPKLAISIYHKPEDLIEIPMYLKELVPEYRFYIRHYAWNKSETILYAIL